MTLFSFSAEGSATNEELGGDNGRCGDSFLIAGESFLCLANRGTETETGVAASEICILGFLRNVLAA